MTKELKALAELKKLGLEDTDFKPYTIEELDVLDAREKHNQKVEKFSQQIEAALKKQEQDQKKLKVLEIIKDKVQFEFLEEREEGKIIQRYFVIGNCMFPVIQEEFDSLKEVLL